ncbi:MAG: hypothetical protein KC777_21745 [Cyanobacteria bacterium HKST-UBA02]|nr:hypothetical protein [Cyanobacteria bacterium HKST-UBA02]
MPKLKPKELTSLLLEARTHHCRITMETLPVGTICLDHRGLIESLDEWTASLLEQNICGEHISALVGENSETLRRLEQERLGYIGRVRLRMGDGNVEAALVLTPAIAMHKRTIDLIYTPA